MNVDKKKVAEAREKYHTSIFEAERIVRKKEAKKFIRKKIEDEDLRRILLEIINMI